MRTPVLVALGFASVLAASTTAFALVNTGEAQAVVKVGTGVEHMELQGEASTFKITAGSRLWVWTKVTGAAESSVRVVFSRDGKDLSSQELKVPRSPYRTQAYRTFRKGDAGSWTAKVLASDGGELGKVAFSVDVD